MPSSTIVENPQVGVPFTIKKERFWLRHLNLVEHLHGYHEIWKNAETGSWSTRNLDKHTLETSLAYLAPRVRSEANPYVQNFAILEPPPVNAPEDTKLRFMGTVGMHRFPSTFQPGNPEPGEPEIGYGLHTDFRGKGIATEALKAFLEYYWDIKEAPHVHVKSISAMHGLNNPGSGHVMEKCGFELVEISKESLVLGNGMKTNWRIMRIQRPRSVSTELSG